ncbi:MAG: aminoglycoside phosphotransferase family protein [Patescibacteria group bacterium]|jgi:aminoglycoside phosphotransferase (APT) family kinase protein
MTVEFPPTTTPPSDNEEGENEIVETESRWKNPVDLQLELPALFDLENISRIIGKPIDRIEVVNSARKNDGTLEKFLVKYYAEGRVYYATSNTNYQMKPAYENHKALHAQMPNQTVPQPVGFIDEINAVIYEELVGDNFVEHMRSTSDENKLELFRKAGEVLNQLHQVDPDSVDSGANTSNASLENIMSSINSDTFTEIEVRDPEFTARLRELYEKLVAYETKLLADSKLVVAHGDFHPKNLLVTDGESIGIVDFTDVSVTARARDIGGFLEQTYAIIRDQEGLETDEQMSQYREAFITGYGDGIKQDDGDVKFYQAWQAWRNSMYYAGKVVPDFIRAENYLQRANSHFADISQ